MAARPVAILGAPLDFGAGRRGVDMGPSAIRVANLRDRLTALGLDVEDLGNIEAPQQESVPQGDPKTKYLDPIAATCRKLAARVAKAAGAGRFPIVLGGDHSIAAGTISGMAKKRRLGVIWIDAHGDINTPETSPSGNVHGMPLAALLGREPKALLSGPKLNPANVALVGLRDLDAGERRHIRDWGVRAFTMRDVDERGLRPIVEEALRIASNGTDGFHLSFDMDAIDPAVAPGVGTPVQGGLSYREAHLIMEMAFDSGRMLSLEVVEVNPVLDVSNRTADLAVELILSALGKKIL
jgi:arginase